MNQYSNCTNVQGEDGADVVDIEQYAKSGRDVPHANRYQIRIDNTKYVVEVPTMTGRDLLILAGKQPPEHFMLNLKLRGGQVVTIGLDDEVDLTAPGTERFMTLPIDQTEG